MLRVIFDTNIYGKLALESDREIIEQKIQSEKNFIVYHFQPIRKEIRDIPKSSKKSRQVRISLLSLYDRITKGRFLKNSIKITWLAKLYYDRYRYYGGIHNWKTNIDVDFMIVACASYYGLDIVYSDDRKTLLNKKALKAYKYVNIKENFSIPVFLKYEELLRKFRGKL